MDEGYLFKYPGQPCINVTTLLPTNFEVRRAELSKPQKKTFSELNTNKEWSVNSPETFDVTRLTVRFRRTGTLHLEEVMIMEEGYRSNRSRDG